MDRDHDAALDDPDGGLVWTEIETAELIGRLTRSSRRALRRSFCFGGVILQYPKGLPFAVTLFF